MRNLKLGQVGVLLGLLLASGAASSVTYTYSDNTTGAPTFNRPLPGNPPTGLSGLGTAVHYDAFTFSVDTTGLYNFLSTAQWDNNLYLYTGSFDPTAPLTNVSIGNDDFPDIGLSGFDDVSLIASTTYILVTTGFENDDFGAFTNRITGPGNVITGGVVPEPGSLALLGLGLLGLGLSRRKAA